MIRLFLYLALIAGLALGFAWMADRPGSLTVNWLGYEVQTTVFIGAIILIFTFAAMAFVVWLAFSTWMAPRRFKRNLEARKLRLGREAVRRGLFAASAGDKVTALRAGAIAKKNLPDEPLALLLDAQSAQLNEDAIGSRQAFERMLDKPELEAVGLRGLYIEAKKQDQIEAAKQFAERALTLNPALAWSSAALFDLQCREGDWRGALKSLSIAKQHKHIAREEADKRRALVLTAIASELEDTQQGKALAYAQEANTLDPSLTPASLIAGRILAAQGNVARATKVIAKAWSASQHPELALIYAHARTGDSPRDRLTRVRTLVSSARKTLTGDIALAVAAIEAKDWPTARAALEPYVGNNPPAEVCQLMARIEAGQNRDKGRAREWLAKAARGAPSPMWVAPDGTITSEWHPITDGGVLGGYQWKTPPSISADQIADLLPELATLDVQEIEAQSITVDKTGTAFVDMAPPVKQAQDTLVKSENVSEATIIEEPAKEPAKPSDAGPKTEPTRVTTSALPVIVPDQPKDKGDKSQDKGEKAPGIAAPLSGSEPEHHSAKQDLPAASPTQGASDADAPKTAAKATEAGANAFAPRIFVAGRAPDDPGPRDLDTDEGQPAIIAMRKPR